jgi:hypothetical protein
LAVAARGCCNLLRRSLEGYGRDGQAWNGSRGKQCSGGQGFDGKLGVRGAFLLPFFFSHQSDEGGAGIIRRRSAFSKRLGDAAMLHDRMFSRLGAGTDPFFLNRATELSSLSTTSPSSTLSASSPSSALLSPSSTPLSSTLTTASSSLPLLPSPRWKRN